MKHQPASTYEDVGGSAGLAAGESAAQNCRPRRLMRNALLVVIVLAGTLLSGGVALSQSGGRFSLGCWAITSAGAAEPTVQSPQFRMSYAGTYVGATENQVVPASPQFRLRTNHFGMRSLLPRTGVPGTPAGDQRQYLPIVGGRLLLLQDLCP